MKKHYFLILMLTCLTITSFGQKKILFIGSDDIDEIDNDVIMQEHIDDLDYDIDTMLLLSPASDDSHFPEDFRTEYDGFVISSSINSGYLKNAHPDFHYIDKPILCWEQGYYAKMGIGSGAGNQAPGTNELNVVAGSEDHVILDDFTSGSELFTTQPTMASAIQTATLASGAKSLVTFTNVDSDEVTGIAIVEKGDSINGDTIAAGRRATFYYHSKEIDLYNDISLALFDRTLQWAMGDIGESVLNFATTDNTLISRINQSELVVNLENMNGNVQLKVHDVSGRTVLSTNAVGGEEVSVPMMNDINGIYLLSVEFNGQVKTQKFLK